MVEVFIGSLIFYASIIVVAQGFALVKKNTPHH